MASNQPGGALEESDGEGLRGSVHVAHNYIPPVHGRENGKHLGSRTIPAFSLSAEDNAAYYFFS